MKKILDEKRLRGEKERDICEQVWAWRHTYSVCSAADWQNAQLVPAHASQVSALEGLKAAQQTMRQRIANSAK